MNTVARSVVQSALAGAAIGFVILGIGGRVIMRVIAHWEGRVPAFTPSGTFTVVMLGAVAGLAGGVVHGLLRRFILQTAIRVSLFVAICVALTWHGANVLLPRPRLSFVALTLAYVAVLELVSSKAKA
ncbi:MAG: hypothetical protein ABIW94_07555 [Gemmatimonadaceae bacterium]